MPNTKILGVTGQVIPSEILKNLGWKKLLKGWREILKEYQDDDITYWHPQLTNTNILSQAAYKIGWRALAECKVERAGKNGCGDLYLWNKEKDSFYVEVELELPGDETVDNGKDKNKFQRRIMGKYDLRQKKKTPIIPINLERAIQEVKKITLDSKDAHRIAICFYVIKLKLEGPKNKYPALINEYTKNFIKMGKEMETDALAWFFPEISDLKEICSDKGKFYFPGIMMFVQYVSPKKSKS